MDYLARAMGGDNHAGALTCMKTDFGTRLRSIADWLLPWRARRRIRTLEAQLKRSQAGHIPEVEALQESNRKLWSQLAAVNLAHQKTKAALQATGNWIRNSLPNSKGISQ